MLTSRAGTDGRRDATLGTDAVLKIRGDDYVTFKWARTFTRPAARAAGGKAFDASRILARWERRTYSGLGYDFGLARSGSAFDPALGFVTRGDYTRVGDRIFYGWYTSENSRVQNHVFSIKGSAYFRNGDGSVESAEASPEWSFTTRSGASGQFGLKRNQESVREPFELAGGVEVPAGSYRFHGFAGAYQSPYGSRRRVDLTLEGGSFYDGWRLSFGVVPTFVVSRHLELGGEYQYNRVGFPERGQALRAQIARVRIRAAASTRLSASAFLQFSTEEKRLDMNLRIRYNPREGTDLYLVYNEGLNTDRRREVPVLPLTESRTLLLKYSRSFLR
jgi:hypothetical protein